MAEYVLPKFEAIIESADHFTLDDEKIRAVIRAKYTHGKPLRGSVTVSVMEEESFGCFRRKISTVTKEDDDGSLVKKTFNIDGQETVEFDIAKELKFERNENNRWETLRNFKIKADVTEGLTGLVQSIDKTVKVHVDTYEITTDLLSNDAKRDSTIDINVNIHCCCALYIDLKFDFNRFSLMNWNIDFRTSTRWSGDHFPGSEQKEDQGDQRTILRRC